MSRLIAVIAVALGVGGCAHERAMEAGNQTAMAEPATASTTTTITFAPSSSTQGQGARCVPSGSPLARGTQPGVTGRSFAEERQPVAGHYAGGNEQGMNQPSSAPQENQPGMNQPSNAPQENAQANEPGMAQPSNGARAESQANAQASAGAGAKPSCAAGESSLVGACPIARVHFAFDSARLTSDDRRVLDRAAECLQRNASVKLTIAGGADERGGERYNRRLGERRADAVARYLASRGVSSDQLSTVSLGKDHPLCAQHNEFCWARNRRTSIHPSSNNTAGANRTHM